GRGYAVGPGSAGSPAFLGCWLALWPPRTRRRCTVWLGEAIAVPLTVLLYLLFVGWLWGWGRWVWQAPAPFAFYGLVGPGATCREALAGLVLGWLSLGLLFGLQVVLGWRAIAPAVDWLGAIGPGAAVGLGVGFAEELLFRGWLLTELDRSWPLRRALWVHAVVFAGLHFVKPLAEIWATLPQFGGLVLLGVVLASWRYRQGGRLGGAIGFHGGLVWAYYLPGTTQGLPATGAVPTWVTGLQDNPLAGGLGLVF
ncbi:MAG: CPBP family intramembrane metalloprotease, partial [Oscillatoriales cyanobacterium SM2_1_8]|nr:CPBP family intramembrane metalloprotease [Oscillatoriales cyanobacterium SM2_1_8]